MNNEEYKLWLESLKVGDEVAIEYHHYSDITYVLTTIEKITQKTRQITVNGYSAKFRDGSIPSSKYDWGTSTRLIPITDEVKKATIRKKLIRNLSKLKFEELSTEKLQRIMEIVKEKGDE